jgi:SAM-dependent methyltransferase
MAEDGSEFRERYPSPNLLYRNRIIKRAIRKHLADGPDILEVGCGTGGFLRWLARGLPAARITGIDLDEVSCRRAAKLCLGLPSVDVRRSDLLSLKGSFDVVLMFDVLEHIEDDERALRHVAEKLSERGILFLTVPSDSSLYGSKDVAYGHYRRYDKRELYQKLGSAGVRVIDDYSWGAATLARLSRSFLNDTATASGSLDAKSVTSARSGPPSTLVRVLHPIYSRFPFLLRFQDPFLRCDLLMHSHRLVVARKESFLGDASSDAH